METAHDIIRAAGGRQVVADALGIVAGQITNRASEGLLPAAWFDTMERLTGQALPRRLFTFKGVSA